MKITRECLFIDGREYCPSTHQWAGGATYGQSNGYWCCKYERCANARADTLLKCPKPPCHDTLGKNVKLFEE